MATAVDHALAGTAGGILATIALYPLDTIRTRLQVGAAAGGDDSFADLFAHASGSLRGFLELYLGLKENVVTVGASNGLYFFLYNVLKDEAARRKLDGTALSLVIAYVAGALNATLTCPLWTVSTRMKLERGRAGAPGIPQPKRSAGMIDSLSTIVRNEGTAALFHGLPAALVLCVNPAIQFSVYERLKGRVLSAPGAPRDLSPQLAFLFGALAKLVATVATYPAQIVQSRMQAANGEGMISLLVRLFREQGIAGWYKGMTSKIVQTVSTSALIFLVYETLLRLILAARRRVAALK